MSTTAMKKFAKEAGVELSDEQIERSLLLASLSESERQIATAAAIAADGELTSEGMVKQAKKLLAKRTEKPKKKSYGARPIKRNRRTKAEIDAIKQAIYTLLKAEQPMTVRQLYYRLVSAQIIQKTEAEYDTVCRLLALMRRSGELPFSWLADATRWQRKPSTHSSLASMLERSAEFYRRSVWDNQDVYVEIWLEKDALAGVLWDVTREWDVPLMVCRGYPSLSYLYSAAEAMQEVEKPCYLYYFGDRDPSGIDIPRKVEADLREFAPDVELHFERVAVTEEQIIEYGLHTRPTKKTDSRAKNFTGESVEVDAIPPAQLRKICRECIEQHVDEFALEQMKVVEEAERETLSRFAQEVASDE